MIATTVVEGFANTNNTQINLREIKSNKSQVIENKNKKKVYKQILPEEQSLCR
jgi:hypothetical protein